jgi:hypothetical protein
MGKEKRYGGERRRKVGMHSSKKMNGGSFWKEVNN